MILAILFGLLTGEVAYWAFFKIREKANAKAKEIVRNIAYSFDVVQMTPGKCRYNYKCHKNAVHEAFICGQDYVGMGFYMEEDYPIIHFWNVSGDTRTDNTLGEWSRYYTYYEVKLIHMEEFENIDQIFYDYANSLCQKMPWWVRTFKNIDF